MKGTEGLTALLASPAPTLGSSLTTFVPKSEVSSTYERVGYIEATLHSRLDRATHKNRIQGDVTT